MSQPSLIFATGNQHKLEEIQSEFNDMLKIVSMRDLGFSGEIDEYGSDLESNAKIKSSFIRDRFGGNVFADDTGLEIECLNGAPGVYSARYAGEHCSFDDNVHKVLDEMKGVDNRGARFRTIMNLWWEGKNYHFEGCVHGHITISKRGTNGFGYDPIFCPSGYEQTFAEMTADQKNSLSHRTLAMKKLVAFLTDELNRS